MICPFCSQIIHSDEMDPMARIRADIYDYYTFLVLARSYLFVKGFVSFKRDFCLKPPHPGGNVIL